MDVLQIKEDENPQQYLWRIGNLKDSGIVKESWTELAPILNAQTDCIKRDDNWRKEYAIAKRYKNCVFGSENVGNDQKLAHKMKIQAQTKNIETNAWLRENARDDLIIEEIKDQISKLKPIEFPQSCIPHSQNELTGVLCFGDEHFGTEYTIYGLNDEVINAYNPGIFYGRMENLLSKTLEIINKNHLTALNVYSFGDFADGVLRVSQLMKLKYGIVESTVMYSEYICYWLNELTKHVHVNYQMTSGNHTELRMLGQPKGTFKNENMDIVVKAFIKLRMEGNPNFTFKENKTGYIYDDIYGYKILGIHGEVNGTGNVVKDFATAYDTKINYLFAAHKHHSRSEEVGQDCEFIGIPSIIGIDTYSMDLRKTSNPGATILIFEVGIGKSIQYFINLK